MTHFNRADRQKVQSLAETQKLFKCSGCYKGWHHECVLSNEIEDIDRLQGILWHHPCNDTCICGGKKGSYNCTCGYTSCKVDLVFEDTIPESWICAYCRSSSIIIPEKAVEIGLEEAVKIGTYKSSFSINCIGNGDLKTGLGKGESSVGSLFSHKKKDFTQLISPSQTFGLPRDRLADTVVSESSSRAHGQSKKIVATTCTDSGTSTQQQGFGTTANSRSFISLPGEISRNLDMEPGFTWATFTKVPRQCEVPTRFAQWQLQDCIKCYSRIENHSKEVENHSKEVECLPGPTNLMENEDCSSAGYHIHHNYEADDSDIDPATSASDSRSETLALRTQRKQARENGTLTTRRKQGDRNKKKYKLLHEISDDLFLLSHGPEQEDFDQTDNNEKTQHHVVASEHQLNEMTEEHKTMDIVPYTPNIQERKETALALISPSQLQGLHQALHTSLMIKDSTKRPRAAADLDEHVDNLDNTPYMMVPKIHFGPITADHDPQGRRGVLVGDTWKGRKGCKQWCVQRPLVSGIAGQEKYGAQSVCLSGGYEDDEDHGEWFIYTGCGGRDVKRELLNQHKQPNHSNLHTKDQTFTGRNASIRTSCTNGLPVRVLRSTKFKTSPFAPKRRRRCYRYDGIYRVELCWKVDGKKGFKICRFLFIRCDNKAAPWEALSQENEEPQSRFKTLRMEAEKTLAEEMRRSSEITERTAPPCWDWKEPEKEWGWVKDPPSTSTRPREEKYLALENHVLQIEYGPGRLNLPTSKSKSICMKRERNSEQALSCTLSHQIQVLQGIEDPRASSEYNTRRKHSLDPETTSLQTPGGSESISMKRTRNSNHKYDQGMSCSLCQTMQEVHGREHPHAPCEHKFCTRCLEKTQRKSVLKEMAERRSIMGGQEFSKMRSIGGGKIICPIASCTEDLTDIFALWKRGHDGGLRRLLHGFSDTIDHLMVQWTTDEQKKSRLQIQGSVHRPGVVQRPSRAEEEEDEDEDEDDSDSLDDDYILPEEDEDGISYC